MDALVFSALIRELAPQLAGARINKIHQPSGDELVLRLWNGEQELRLYLRVRGGDATLYLSERRFPNPFTPPRFCQLLRARLSRLVSLQQWHAERLAVLCFAGKRGESYRLLLDFRRVPNLILLAENGKVVDALHRDPASGAVPGGDFLFPEPHSINLLKTCSSLLAPAAPEELRLWLLREVAPMPPWLAGAIEQQVRGGSDPLMLLVGLHEGLVHTALQPVLLEIADQLRLLPFPPAWLATSAEASFPSLSRGLEFHDTSASPAETRDPLLSVVSRGIERLERRRVRIEQDRARLEDLGRQQHLAELLLANRHRLHRGMDSVEVEDYLESPPAPVRIPLDARLTPQQNIEQKFKQVRKLRRGQEHVERRAQETSEELDWFAEMRLAIEECRDEIERDQLSRELAGAGYLSLRQEPPGRRRPEVPEPLRRATSPGGYELVWGKGPRGNEKVSHQLAHVDDLWFHAYQRPGCHLVLRKAGRGEKVPDRDIGYAASLAAGYSAARHETLVEVMVASVADVRKPRGARPGLVSVARFMTVRVAPQRLPQDIDNG